MQEEAVTHLRPVRLPGSPFRSARPIFSIFACETVILKLTFLL
jgi:hypothetical protein